MCIRDRATQANEIQLKYYEQHGLTLSAPEKTALQKVKPSPVQRPLDLSLIHI